jgi:hypothetical protein
MKWFNINANYALGLQGQHLLAERRKNFVIFKHEQVSAAGAGQRIIHGGGELNRDLR